MKLDIVKIAQHPSIVFISLIDVGISLLTALLDFVSFYSKHGYFQQYKIPFNMTFFEITIRFVTVIFLYFLWKSFIKVKKQTEEAFNNSNVHWYNELDKLGKTLTQNINDSQRVLNSKIWFLHFQARYEHLKNSNEIQYFNELVMHGFSKEVLAEIGVSKKQLDANYDFKMSQKLLDKFLDYSSELSNTDKNPSQE